MYIRKPRIKTGIEYISVLYEDAAEIWELYGGKLPLISNTKMNLYLKELAAAAEIDKNITTLTARHTYATYLLSTKRLSLEIVQKMLGHTTPRQTLWYSKMLDTTVLEVNASTPKTKVATKNALAAIKSNESELDTFKEILGI